MSEPRRKRRPPVPKPKAMPAPDEAEAAEKAHIESLIASGLAAKADAEGKLPAGATHEIVETRDGEITVVRRRFSAY